MRAGRGATRSDDRLANLESAYRTREEKQLGRDFTAEEAAEYERQIKLKAAQHQATYRREQIRAKMASIATSLERGAEDVRRAADQSEHYGLASAVSRVQHDVAWLFPNLGTDNLTTDLLGWLPDGRRDQAARPFARGNLELTG